MLLTKPLKPNMRYPKSLTPSATVAISQGILGVYGEFAYLIPRCSYLYIYVRKWVRGRIG